MTHTMRDGTQVEDRRLGRLIQFDERSRNYPVRTLIDDHTKHPRPRSYTWRCFEWHNQRSEGACVSFAHAHRAVARPQEHRGDFDFTRLISMYRRMQQIDPWEETREGGADGTSVLAGAQIFHQDGFYKEYRWAFDLRDVVLTLGYLGPLVAGTWWWSGMFDTDTDGFIEPTGYKAGGHAYLLRGVKIIWLPGRLGSWEAVDLDKSYVLIRNSWGRDWGFDGDARMRLVHLQSLLADSGEACFPVEEKAA